MRTELTKLLNITYPIIQAPMAGGISTPELVAAVSNHGGLGMIGAGYLSAEQMKQQVQEVRKQTTQPVGVNLFVPEEVEVTGKELETADHFLQGVREELGIEKQSAPTIPSEEDRWQAFEEQVDVIIRERLPVCSFTFGLPPNDVITEMKKKNIILIGTATTVEEALAVQEAGLDMVVVQGSEAGGHRGNFINDHEGSLIGLMSLIPQTVDHVDIPVIAAGGIMDGRGLSAAFALGAQGVQMGTAFLTCTESGASSAHKQAVMETSEEKTVLTRAFSGKWARGIQNSFIANSRNIESQLPGFPVQNILTKHMRKIAGEELNTDYMSLWSGQSPRLAEPSTAAELINRVMEEAKDTVQRLSNS
ncbi:NAD(P)H-dependent flavin oxidoreductase [Alteribacillus iranensis]|uniref:Probable nitronate monooxygenase n=1 Tax=Alteribacillus iranensis TaxID=930128 RepID=A0A1I2B516_9BACI|nr:nitronate monooxygenase [Alteribacillus iranensis]SFE51261.1 nitronate monooxygenase [Alteribacillus iranensis]